MLILWGWLKMMMMMMGWFPLSLFVSLGLHVTGESLWCGGY